MIEYSSGNRRDKIHKRFSSKTFEWASCNNDFKTRGRFWNLRQVPTIAFLSPLNTGNRVISCHRDNSMNGVVNQFSFRLLRHDTYQKATKGILHFSLNLNNDKDNDDDNEIQKNLPEWAKSLFRVSLPTVDPKKSSSKESYAKDIQKNFNDNNFRDSNGDQNLGNQLTSPFFMPETNTNIGPLASLVNVEALLAASGLDDINGDSDSEFFSTPLSDKVRREISSPSTTTKNIASRTNNGRSDIPSSDGLSMMQEMGDWNSLARNLQKSVNDLLEATPKGPALELSAATELILKSATSQIEDVIGYASTTITPEKVKNLILKAGNSLLLDENADNFQIAMEYIVSSTENLARERGLNVTSAAEQARSSTRDTIQLVSTVNGLLSYGYVGEIDVNSSDEDYADEPKNKVDPRFIPKPLFYNFPSIRSVDTSEFNMAIKMGVDMATLSGAIYMNTLPTLHSLDHSLVANGTSADVKWMVTDSIVDTKDFDDLFEDGDNTSNLLVRTITIRGFDASDENVDREKLLNAICTADPVDMGKRTKGIKIHKGLLQVAKEVYNEVRSYIDFTGPKHKIILNGHSIGGSISVLILLLLLEERGVNFIIEKVLRVFTFGSPPVAKIEEKENSDSGNVTRSDCDVLTLLGLPASKVYGYVQPWDPIVRLFSTIDPLYPLVGDLGEDGVTLYASGPDRALRPITRAIFESWENWPTLRDNFSGTGNQNYRAIGIQYLLLPESSRYLTDRFVSVNIGTSPVESVVRSSSNELLLALPETFPLDTFTISYVPTALRSFIHHFYPAYGKPFADYFHKNLKKAESHIFDDTSDYDIHYEE